MHIACSKGFMRLVAYMKYEIDLPVDEIDVQGFTPAHLAIRESKEAVIFLLIAWGINLEDYDSKNNTLLHYAAKFNNYRVARVLIIKGANRNAKNLEGKTPFDLAMDGKYNSIARILVCNI